MSQYSDDDYSHEDDSEMEDEDEEDEYEPRSSRKGRSGKKRGRSNSDSDGRRGSKKKSSGSAFIDWEVEVDDDVEDDDDDVDVEDGKQQLKFGDFSLCFIVSGEADLPNEDSDHRRQYYQRGFHPHEEDVDELEKRTLERLSTKYAKDDYELDDVNDVDQQALLPSVRDPKLWLVKCAIGREREVAVCLMQKIVDRGSEFKIRSAIALDHLQNYVYIEADMEAHVKEAIKGMRNIYANQKILLVPIKEMTAVLSVESKAIDLSRDSWVRMKLGIYKGDLAQVVDVDNVRKRVTVKLIPRIDLQALANKLEGTENVKKKAFAPPPRFMNIDEARELHIRVEHRRDPMTGDYFENIGGMLFKDGFLYKKVSTKSIAAQNVTPTFDELERFKRPNENGEIDFVDESTLFANRKKGHFMKGDAVIVIKGDLKNLKGWIEKVDEENVLIRSEMKDLPNPIAVNGRELCKYFEPGNFVKVVSGIHEGGTGMIVKVDQHMLIILSDTTKEHICVFADHVAKSAEVTKGVTKIGDYELHDLVILSDFSFGVILKLDSEAIQILKGVPDSSEVSIVKASEIKYKIWKKINVQDRYKNVVAVKDVVRVIEGPSKGKQGPVVQIYKGVLFIHDRHNLEHTGFICTRCSSCVLAGGNFKTPALVPPSPRRFQRADMGYNPGAGGRHQGGRGRRGDDHLVGTYVKIRLGPFKGYSGRLVEVKDKLVRVELEAKIVTVERKAISDMTDNVVATPQYNMGSQTPMHPSRTPLHPCMTPMRHSGATPIHDGMRTPMRGRAWNPYMPMSPPRDNWEDGNPGSWGTSPYEAATPGSDWGSSTPGRSSYRDAGTPINNANAPSPMTPSSTSYLPTTPGGQAMTPGTDLDVMSLDIGGDAETRFIPGILVNVHKAGEDRNPGVIRDVLPDGSCVVALGHRGEGETIRATQNKVSLVCPKKNERVKILGGKYCGSTAKVIGEDGQDGIVKLDESLDIKILKLTILAKLVHE
ncbi:Transcription elongation factor Spt5 [Arabidopsis thaliana]|uniref:Putative transcription elongation factor SPT5 homolog 2 n=1 Tax=Arabidopsis thaliana TaxID=3702 RepID=SPT52_ARATH|nr:Transcription elongation factor Spt5 [Arabidopsis thaliana]O80770.2 RecName: Full=Putative transcription elongation factor SPT5 homolog 2 [Arabidopsis thaliana]AEC08936.1 Transcription elongation factor Spt5 [Arabidopsis thaliana]|eukprot:NP_180968.2 Transcription elongation factor Spt5 [Arabidopsis thaliana]